MTLASSKSSTPATRPSLVFLPTLRRTCDLSLSSSIHPSDAGLAKVIEDFASIVLLPLYFAASGLRTQIASINSPTAGLLLLMILVIATAGKFLGCALAARAVNIPWRESLTIGVLMNTRGLVELIVLNLGLDAKVIDVQLFTAFVIMALATTFMTSPIVSLIYPPRMRKYGMGKAPSALPAAPSLVRRVSILVPCL